jgi:hypothetical protein
MKKPKLKGGGEEEEEEEEGGKSCDRKNIPN